VLWNLSYKKVVKSEMMMRNISVLGVSLMVFLACLPVPGLAEPDSPGNKSLDEAKEMLKEMTSQSEEMLNQSKKEYEWAKNESGMNSSDLQDFEAMMSGIKQLISFLNDLIDSAVTIIDHITAFTKKIST
jgi:predicted PurR-regulated permease PerM